MNQSNACQNSKCLDTIYPFFLSLIVVLSLLLAGCGDEATGPDVNDENDIDEPNPPAVVEIVGQSFSPSNLQIDAGTTVTWENDSDLVHTVTSGSDRQHDDKFNSGDLAPGDTYSYTFNETGSYDYFCIPHPGMEGNITVVNGDDDNDDNDGY